MSDETNTRSAEELKNTKFLRDTEVATYRDAYKPEICPILGIPLDDPTLDHDHKTGKVRGAISRQGNTLLGKIENYLDHRVNTDLDDITVVENVLRYMKISSESSDVMPYHPEGLRQVCKRFSTMKKAEQVSALENLGISSDLIDGCSNSRKRTNLYRKVLKGELSS